MNSNDRIMLEQLVAQQYQERASASSVNGFFENFVAEQLLKDYDLTFDEIESGNVDGSDDGGIDSIYVLVNRELAQEDSDVSSLKKGVEIEMVLIQSKFTTGFAESSLDKLVAATEELFDLSKDLDSLRTTFNEALLSSVANFRRIHEALATKFPKLKFRYVYQAAEILPSK